MKQIPNKDYELLWIFKKHCTEVVKFTEKSYLILCSPISQREHDVIKERIKNVKSKND